MNIKRTIKGNRELFSDKEYGINVSVVDDGSLLECTLLQFNHKECNYKEIVCNSKFNSTQAAKWIVGCYSSMCGLVGQSQ